jgi:hypothetical protein
MEYIKKISVIVLVILTLNLSLTNMAFAQQVFVSPDVPKHEPQSWSTPEEDIPPIKEKKTSGWTWVILIALLGGVAAAAGGGGGGDSGSGGSDTGGYAGSW